MGASRKLLAVIVCIASARGIDFIDGILHGLNIGGGGDNDDADLKGMCALNAVSAKCSQLPFSIFIVFCRLNSHGTSRFILCLLSPRNCDNACLLAKGEGFHDAFADNFSSSFAGSLFDDPVSEALFGD